MVFSAEFFDSVLCRAFERSRYPRENPNVISVTEVTQCLRYSYFMRRKPICAPQVVPLLLGIEGHRIIAEYLQEEGFITERLVCGERDGIRLCGRVDAYHPDRNIVVEVKFVESPPKEPYEDHEFQTQIYMAMLEAKMGYIVYYSRDPLNRTRVFHVFPSDRVLDEAFERAKILRDALLNDKPPPAEKGRWCRWCQYRYECYQLNRKGSKPRTKQLIE